MVIFIIWKHLTWNLSQKYNSAWKIFMKKIIMYFSSIGHHIISDVAKFKFQIPHVSGEIKKKNLVRGRLDQLK
jgi:hypothetical protein